MKKILVFLILCAGIFTFFVYYTGDKPAEVTQQELDDCGDKCGIPAGAFANRDKQFSRFDFKVKKAIEEGKLSIVFFYSKLCPHCDDALAFFDALESNALSPTNPYFKEVERYRRLADENVKLILEKHELIDNEANLELFEFYSKEYGIRPSGLPVIFIGERAHESFLKQAGAASLVDLLLAAQGRGEGEKPEVYKIPILGEVTADSVFLPLFTVCLGFLDGLNPCAMWVLALLLGIMAYSRSRKRMLIVGVTFVIASGVVYFALMTAWLNLFLVVGFNRIVLVVLACVAIIMGLINLKEIFFFKGGVSLMIPESAKPGLYKKVRKILKEKNLLLTIGLTFVFALFVNMIELACTAGFPAIFTKILADRNEPVVMKYLYMALYNVMYIQPLLIIVVIFSFTMGHFKMQEKHAKILKLISGGLMLFLGILLLVKPEIMI